MKKSKTIIKRALLASILVLISLAFAIAVIMIGKIETFQKVTHQDILSDKKRIAHYGLGTNKNPSDFGFSQYTTVSYESTLDKTKLEAWYIPPKVNSSKHALVLVHGMGANRLRTVKYLQLIRENQLDKIYSIMIPDMRNSGNSQESRVSMGYKFAEDLHATLIFLRKKYHIQNITIYAFSMGAMATQILLHREKLYQDLKSRGLSIDKIIFDSPLVNVEDSLHFAGKQKNIPSLLIDYAFWIYNIKTAGFAQKMRLHYLYQKQKIPLLILQAKNDTKGFYPILVNEMKQLKNDAVRVLYFPTGHHVKIYQNPKTRLSYSNAVSDFLKQNHQP